MNWTPEAVRAMADTLFQNNPSNWRTPGSAPLSLYDIRVGRELLEQYEAYALTALEVATRHIGDAS